MNLASTATGTVAIDPALLALIPIVTVVLTILAGVFGAWIQNRREHQRWVREKRFDAFVAARVFVGQLEWLRAELLGLRNGEGEIVEDPSRGVTLKRAQALLAEFQDLKKRASEVTVPFDLLGPDNVDDAIGVLIAAVTAEDEAQTKEAKKRLTREARAALSIRTGLWARLKLWRRRRPQ